MYVWIPLILLKTENTVTKYFLLLQITIHPFFSLGWSMNSAMDQKKKKKKTQGKQTLYTDGPLISEKCNS